VRTLPWLRQDRDGIEPVEAPGVRDVVLRPGADHDLERFLRPAAALGHVDAVTGELVRIGTAPDTDFEPTAREEIGLRDLPGHAQRVIERQHENAGAEADTLGP